MIADWTMHHSTSSTRDESRYLYMATAYAGICWSVLEMLRSVISVAVTAVLIFLSFPLFPAWFTEDAAKNEGKCPPTGTSSLGHSPPHTITFFLSFSRRGLINSPRQGPIPDTSGLCRLSTGNPCCKLLSTCPIQPLMEGGSGGFKRACNRGVVVPAPRPHANL